MVVHQATWLTYIIRIRVVFWICIALNLVGAIAGGLYWYGPMLWNVPFWALPFVPDCPLAAFLWVIAVVGIWAGHHWPWYNTFTSFACMKYGAWTVFFWLYVWTNVGFGLPPEGVAIPVLMFVSHIGLFLEGVLLLPYSVPLSLPKRLSVLAWYILAVFLDYRITTPTAPTGYHPPLGPDVPVSYAFLVAAFMTALLGSFFLAFAPLIEPRVSVSPPRHNEHEPSQLSS